MTSHIYVVWHRCVLHWGVMIHATLVTWTRIHQVWSMTCYHIYMTNFSVFFYTNFSRIGLWIKLSVKIHTNTSKYNASGHLTTHYGLWMQICQFFFFKTLRSPPQKKLESRERLLMCKIKIVKYTRYCPRALSKLM